MGEGDDMNSIIETYLITGANGFIGRMLIGALAERATDNNIQVVGFVAETIGM